MPLIVIIRSWVIRDWSLITGKGGGVQNGRGGGSCEVLPLEKGGGGGKGFSYDERGGGTTSFGVVFTWELEVLAIVMGEGDKMFLLFKRGSTQVLPCLKVGRKRFRTRDFPIL